MVDLPPLGLRVGHPEATRPLLLRLGMVDAEPRALLEDPRVRAAVEAAADEEELAAIVAAVLSLVGAAGLRPGELPWLATLPLPDEDGGWRPAGELLLPAGPLARLVDRDAGVGVVRTGVAHEDVLVAVGVIRGFATLLVEDGSEGVDGLEDWLASLGPDEEPGVVVRDLDLVRDDAWPQALEILESGGLLSLPYVRWWLADTPVLSGRRPRELRVPRSDPLLVGLYEDAPGDPQQAMFLGARSSLVEVLADDPDDVLDRLASDRALGRRQVRALHAALARAEVRPPVAVRAVLDGELQVVPAEDAVVVDRPDLLARIAPYAVVPVPLDLARALAGRLDLALASEVVPAVAVECAGGRPWDAPGADARVCRHDVLRVHTAGGQPVEVVWVHEPGVDHVVGPEGESRALAWRLGHWGGRHEILTRLRGNASDAEADLDEV
ncbi:MAG: hypothetical protein WD794_05680 [Mycobacteriales bacterium]